MLPLIAVFSGLPIIGWAKPVPVNVSRFRHPRRDFMIVAAAGPVSNFCRPCRGRACSGRLAEPGDDRPSLIAVLWDAVEINVLLAVFNMLPMPPLDGGNVLAGLLPRERRAAVRSACGSTASSFSTR